MASGMVRKMKSKVCIICGASFVPEKKDQDKCNVCKTQPKGDLGIG